MGRTSYKVQAEAYGATRAINMVSFFINHPEWRGPNFTWDSLPMIVKCMAHPYFRISIGYKIKNRKREEELAEMCANTAFSVATNILRTTGLIK